MSIVVHNSVEFVTVTEGTKVISSSLLTKYKICTISAAKCVVCLAYYYNPISRLQMLWINVEGLANCLTVLN